MFAMSAVGDTRSEDTLLFDRVSQVSYLSDALLDEGYDTARRSRGRDQQLLRDATNAIVSKWILRLVFLLSFSLFLSLSLYRYRYLYTI